MVPPLALAPTMGMPCRLHFGHTRSSVPRPSGSVEKPELTQQTRDKRVILFRRRGSQSGTPMDSRLSIN